MTTSWNLSVLNWQLFYKNFLDWHFLWVIYNRQCHNNDTVIFLIISLATPVEAAPSLPLEVKFLPGMKARKEITTVKATKNKQKQTSQENSIIHDNKNGTNTLIKLVRLMEVTGRHNFIRTRASDLVFWNLRVTGMLTLIKKWYHWKKELIEIGNLRMFWTSKNCVLFFVLCVW